MNSSLPTTKRRQDIPFEEKDQALRNDVRTLGAMVGELIREQNGEELFELVEDARLRSIRRREDNEKDGEDAARTLPIFFELSASGVRVPYTCTW